VCLSVIYKPQQWVGLGPFELSSRETNYELICLIVCSLFNIAVSDSIVI
jgi:hypothetical protein